MNVFSFLTWTFLFFYLTRSSNGDCQVMSHSDYYSDIKTEKRYPSGRENLVLKAPIKNWDEAIPLGNGLCGGLLWGEKSEIHLGLDRGDLWDDRTNGLREWWKTQTWKKQGKMWEDAYYGAYPSKLPAGRIELKLTSGQKVDEFALNYATAEGFVKLSDGREIKMFFSAVEPVALICIPDSVRISVDVLSPLAVSRVVQGDAAGPDSHSIQALGYSEAVYGNANNAQWYLQTASMGLKYCALTEIKYKRNETFLAVTITTTNDSSDPVKLAKLRCDNALARGYNKMLIPHVNWWKKFWKQSCIALPEPRFQNYYTFARYLYGAGSRKGAPPMPLQGVWSANNGSLPPWKGDYHNDLNTEMTYIAYFTGGNFEEGASYLDFLWKLRPFFRSFAKDFYQTSGLATPGVMSITGQPLGGWASYSLSPTMSAWNAHLFYLHWRYTVDSVFLRNRAYPWCRDVGLCMAGLLKPDKDGILKLMRSSSPEIGGNRWLTPNSNFDLMCLKMLFLSLQEMAATLAKRNDERRWSKLAEGLGDYHVTADGELMLDSKLVLRESHRHPANLMAIYPFNLITNEGTEQDKKRILVTLARPEWTAPTHYEWCGYTWAWMSNLYARIGDAESAFHHLDVFINAYLSRNGFHVNQDQSGVGFGAGGGRPFTLEGNFLGLQAINEMLLQSWSPSPGKMNTGVIRIFPSMPWRWHTATFTDLRAEGGYRVSAIRENNATIWFRIKSSTNGILRVRDNFKERTVNWNIKGVRKVHDNYEIPVRKGQVIEARIANKGDVMPEQPANAAKPL